MLREIMTREKGRNEKKNFPGVGVGVLNAKKIQTFTILERLDFWNDGLAIHGGAMTPFGGIYEGKGRGNGNIMRIK
ncbi:hypothetical protein [Bifidobacterium angulatum]|uniref:hypothetical protein n=1 Tax=Bifidobacterium angulatum TaxID=1683 RepID=UPI002657D784|nr:hypothetical protein [Bifidobacterium angulatum]